MTLHISQNKTLGETQEEFNKAYPFLRLEFYRNIEPGFARRHLKSSMPMTAAGLRTDGELELNDLMTVGHLEDTLLVEFNLHAQVSRRSGTVWLETTITDNWTLKQQNDHGREISEHMMFHNISKKDDIDYD